MIARNLMRRASLGSAAAAVALSVAIAGAAPASAQPGSYGSGTYRPTSQVQLSVGEGQMINLPSNVANVWTSNPKVADVFVNSPRQLNLFGKEFGEATVIATSANGSVVYGAQVRVSQNLPTVNDVLRAVLPEADVRVATVGQTAILSGTVGSPEDVTLAAQLVNRELNPGVDMSQPGALCKICVVNRLRIATPLQVALKVRVAEVNRSLLKTIGVNLLSRDTTGGFQFGIGQGDPGTNDATGKNFLTAPTGTTLAAAGKLFGLDLLGTLDLAAKDGLVTLLAEPTLTALSGETASFLAGGEFPIPVSQSLGTITIEYKQYGVGLAFTPIVLADGRISMRVRPEVSELSNEGAVKLNGYLVPALTTRRAETTVELGSGQSFMIAGLLRNTNTNDVSKAPFLGDLPILGALFRSTSFRRQETELVIIVTPYLVRPVSGQLASPADGYRAPSDPELNLEGQTFKGVSGPRPTGPVVRPGIGAATSASAAVPAATAPVPTPGFKL